jgi:hypothetical protein
MSGAASHHDNLPKLRVLRAVAVAQEPQRLPPLPTTALHGVLTRALAKTAPELLEPPGAPLAGVGVTDRAPASLVLSPERWAPGKPHFALEAGEQISFRLVLIGARARERVPEVLLALRDGLEGGIAEPTTERRPALRLADLVTETPPPLEPLPPPRAHIQLLTPVRIARQGRVTAQLDAAAFWDAVARRADALARLYGHGPVVAKSTPRPEMRTAETRLRRVAVRRYSTRQGRRMVWPGLIGDFVLEGSGLAAAWPLLRFCELVQVGKATTFGFGRYVLRPADR